MKFPLSLAALIFALFSSIALFAQQVPDGYFFDKRGQLIYTVGPTDEYAAKAVAESGGYQSLGLSTGVLENKFAVVIMNAVPEKGKYILEKQKDMPATFTVDGEKITGLENIFMGKRGSGKAKLEFMVVMVSMQDFEKIIAAGKVYVEFGTINFLISAENLQAFRYLSSTLEKEQAEREALNSEPDAPATNIRVKGYYRKDGIYVQAHTRRRPKN
jgi:hypothetical protein